MKQRTISFAVVTAMVFGGLGTSTAGVITFDDIAHGEEATMQIPGLTIGAVNFSNGIVDAHGDHPNMALGFNTLLSGTPDPDLEGPGWAGGNLTPFELANLELGTVIIIAENSFDDDGDGRVDDPDDEGDRLAGMLIFDLANPRSAVGFDLIDIEGIGIGEEPGHFATFLMGGVVIDTIAFADFLDGGAFDQDAEFGNNTVNRIAPIGGFGLFDRIEITLGGSGAVDNLVLLPAPGALALLGLGLGLLAFSRRSHRNEVGYEAADARFAPKCARKYRPVCERVSRAI